MYFLWFFFVFMLNEMKTEKIISIGFNDMGGGYYTTVSMGTPRLMRYLVFDLYNNFTLFAQMSKEYTSSSRKTFNMEKILNNEEIAMKYSDVFCFSDNICIEELKYYALEEDNKKYYYDSIGLGSSFDDESFSVVHSLFIRGAIEHKSFGLVTGTTNAGYLTFGGIPEQYLQQRIYVTKVNTIPKYVSWTIPINGITIGDNVYPLKDNIASISTKTQYISIPCDVFDIIVDKVFIKYFEKDECSKKTFDRTSITIQCKRSIVKDLPPIGIVFGSTSITLQGDELFKDFFSDSISIIRKNESDKSSQWVLGVRFIRLFNILFDYKNKEVSFYSNKTFKTVTLNSNSKRISLMIINKVVLIIGIVLIIITRKITISLYK